MPWFICPNCKQRSVDIDGVEGFSEQAPQCRHCGFGFLFELMDDYYPAPSTGFVVCDAEGRILALGRGVFELTGYQEKDVLGKDVMEAFSLSGWDDGKNPSELSREWGVRRLGEKLELRTRNGLTQPVTADFFPAYDDDGGLMVALARRALDGHRSLSTHSSQCGLRAMQTRRPCQISRCGKTPQYSRGTRRCRSRSILTGSSLPREAEALREPAHVRVDDDALRVAELGRDDVRGLPRDARQARELVEGARHLAVEVLDQHLHRPADRLRLLAEEAGGPDVVLELLDRHGEVVLGPAGTSGTASP